MGEAPLHKGLIVRDGKGRYALPTAHAAVRAAARLTGVVSGKSAAAYYGWSMKTQPELPVVPVPRNRRVARERREGVDLKWREIPPEHVTERDVTSKAVPGLDVEPQLWIGNLGRVDLADKRLRLVVEAESFEFHGKRRLLKRD